jgi:predicted nuclease of predicted toxin-antitoxin system
MKLLLDECIAHDLKQEFSEHHVATVVEAGFTGLSNGDLLRAASGQYDVLITVDRNLLYQQNISSLMIAVVIIQAGGITYAHLKTLTSQVKETIKTIQPGQMVTVSKPEVPGSLAE